MKNIMFLQISFLTLSFCSFGQLIDRGNQKIIIQKDSFHIKQAKLKIESEKRRKEIEEGNRIDSLMLNKILIEALEIAKKKINYRNFTEEYTDLTEDSTFNVNVKIKIGYIFSAKSKNILIRRITPWSAIIDVFMINNMKIVPVIFHQQEGMTYLGDTIRDVNGDGFKDFLIHWYPSSGCCRRDVFNVFINKKNSGNFTNDYQFINPTFSSKEKIVRGVEYGHSGQAGLYKYRWNGLRVDTVEFIYPDQSNKKKRHYLKTTKNFYSSDNVKTKKLKFIPKEYLKIENFDWFNDY